MKKSNYNWTYTISNLIRYKVTIFDFFERIKFTTLSLVLKSILFEPMADIYKIINSLLAGWNISSVAIKILSLCDVSCVPFINLRRINSPSVALSFVPSFSNSQYLDVFNLCTYCIIDSFGSVLVSMNLVLSATTCLFKKFLVVYFLNYSNNLFIS